LRTFLRIRISFRTFCLGVIAFTNPPICQSLAFNHCKQLVVAFAVCDFQRCAAIVAEIELGKIAMQMRFAAMLVHANHAALEHGEHAFDEACVTKGHLSWKTRQENRDDMIAHGTVLRGERNGQAKLTEPEVLQILARKGTMVQREIAAQFGISSQLVGHIHRGEAWAWLPDR
jgi:hypothetical protein